MKGDEMSTRRRFGTLVDRSSKDGKRKYVEARYRPPAWAYSKWPNLPERISKRFDKGYVSMAEAWLAEEERRIRLGTWEPPAVTENKAKSASITFSEYALNYVNTRRKPNGERIAETTRQKYLQYLNDYLLPVLGSKHMGSITPKDIERWFDSMKVGKAGEGSSVKFKTLVLLRAIFKNACEQELDANGTTLLTVNPVRINMAKPSSDIAYADITMSELKTLYDAMPPRLAVLIYLCGVMGLRPGEAYAIQRRDVVLRDDLTEGVLHITKAAKPIREIDPETGRGHRRIIIGSTKTTGSVRHPPIPGFVCRALDLHMRRFVPDSPSAYLFTGQRTRGIISDQTVRNAWYKARKSVPHLDEKKVRFYDLRHRSISYMKSYTYSDKTVMEFAGHERLDTDRHYQHALEPERRKILDGMESEARMADMDGDRSNPPEQEEPCPDSNLSNIARLLEKTSVDARIELLRVMDCKEREEVMPLLSPQIREETMSRLLSAPERR